MYALIIIGVFTSNTTLQAVTPTNISSFTDKTTCLAAARDASAGTGGGGTAYGFNAQFVCVRRGT